MTTTTAATAATSDAAEEDDDTGGRGEARSTTWPGVAPFNAAADLGVSVDELEAITEEDRGPNLEALVENGNNPIIAVGFAFGDALAPIAEENPDTFFGWIDGYYDGANVITTGFAEHEGSFLVGVAAALNSPNGNVGFIGGQEIDLIKKFEAGFTAGAQAGEPGHRRAFASTSPTPPASTRPGVRPIRPRRSRPPCTRMAPTSSTPLLAAAGNGMFHRGCGRGR